MKKSKIYLSLLLVIFMGACTKDFDVINKNTNAPTASSPANLLPSAIFEPIAAHMTLQTWVSDQVMHYYVRRNDNQVDAYDFASGQAFFNDIWARNYLAIWNINDIIKAAQAQGLTAYEAAGKTMKAYYMATNSELWIDAPASKAGLGLDDTSPAYDKQQAIYSTVLKDLDDANTLFSKAGISFVGGGDVLFNGNISRWRKLANSLRLRYLLRLSNKAEINASAEIKKMIDNPTQYPIITTNAEAGFYDFTGISPNISSFSLQAATSFSGMSMSKRMQEVYASYNDPRIDFFFRKPGNATKYPNHEGVPNGLTREAAQSWNGNGDAHTSILTTRFNTSPGSLDYSIISYAEVQFILAEATMKGWITTSTTAKTYYENAISANFSQWGLTVPAGFFDLPEVKWDNTMARLMDQKWMAYFFNNTIEAWGEYKRTGLPVLKIGSLATTVTGGKVPTRVFYPTLEQSINAANYKAATSSIGGDIITAKHWYQN